MGLANSYCCSERITLETHPFANNDKSADMKRFERARCSADFNTLVVLLASTETLLTKSKLSAHPWARPPETVGALVAAHLAVLISDSSADAQKNIDSLVEFGVVPGLVQLLKSSRLDRLHAGAVTLVFLTDKSTKASLQLVSQSIHPELERCLQSGSFGLQLTILSLIRNIHRVDSSFRGSDIIKNSLLIAVDLALYHSEKSDQQSCDYTLESLQIIYDIVQGNSQLCSFISPKVEVSVLC
jgi:hypothetical protein